MPITYDVHQGGHFIHAIASPAVLPPEFVDYEIAHAIDPQIKTPVAELLEIRPGACKAITQDDMVAVLARRQECPRGPTPHRCAIVVADGDTHAWNLARFYEGMVRLHYPENVIVFGDVRIARIWLGVDDVVVDPATKPMR
jgi:hypothetical protein